LSTPNALDEIPMAALAAWGSPAMTPLVPVKFVGVATLFITPTATDDRLVAEEKFERPIATELVEPAVQVFR
jgi:hypothetical protein